MTQSIKRVYHPYWVWEESRSPMWGKVDDRKKHLDVAIKFTGDHEAYGAAMYRVLKDWPISCEHNLSDISQNRRAWIGHAACAIQIKCPEDIVREAWHHLTDEQRIKANAAADKAINEWENKKKGLKVCQKDQLELTF
jgi:hypothetical protein